MRSHEQIDSAYQCMIDGTACAEPLTKNELTELSDQQLLEIVNISTSEHCTSNFKERFGVEFGYSSVTQELSARGYVNGWYKKSGQPELEPQLIMLHRPAAAVRLSLSVSEVVAQRWKRMMTPYYHFQGALADEALGHFMDQLESGKVRYIVEIGGESGKSDQ